MQLKGNVLMSMWAIYLHDWCAFAGILALSICEGGLAQWSHVERPGVFPDLFIEGLCLSVLGHKFQTPGDPQAASCRHRRAVRTFQGLDLGGLCESNTAL
jgi:hypothetical protein